MIVNRIVTSLAAGSSAQRGGGHCYVKGGNCQKLQMGQDIEKGDWFGNLGCLADFYISNVFWIEAQSSLCTDFQP